MICDFAETYNIYNYKALPLSMVVRLLCGLRENSRVKMNLAGIKASPDKIIMASILDRLNWLVWVQTEDGAHNRNKPESIAKTFFKEEVEDTSFAFESGEDFDLAISQIRERIKNG